MTLKIVITKENKVKLLLNGEETKFTGLTAIKKAQEWTSNQIESLSSMGKEVIITVKNP